MRLSHIIQQSNRNAKDTALIINAEYDEVERTAEFISIEAYDYATSVRTPLTYIFSEQLTEALDEIMDSVKWDEIFIAQRDEDVSNCLTGKSDLFNQIADISRMHAKVFYGIDLGGSFNKFKAS